MRMLEVKKIFQPRRMPHPNRSIDIFALLAAIFIILLMFHIYKLNGRLKLEKLDANFLNNTRKADINILFFNRCTKVGSESFWQLLDKLAALNNLKIKRNDTWTMLMKRQWPVSLQRELAEEMVKIGENYISYVHTNWIDFKSFNLPKPIYINLVRDPVERIISWFFYTRKRRKYHPERPPKPKSWYDKDFNKCVRNGDPECQFVPYTVKDFDTDFKRQSLFFCGHDDDCLPFDSPYAIKVAKEHVEREYAVVGTWEETNITLNVLEKYIPRFFQNIQTVFGTHSEELTNCNRNKNKPKIDDDVKELIRRNLTHEYDFYYFCKQRLYKQFLALNLPQT